MLKETGLGKVGLREAWLGELAGERLFWRRAGWGAMGGNGGGTVGARRLLPTRRRGRARGITGLPEPGGRGGAGGEERVLETWGGGMVGRAGAGRLAVEEGKGQLGVHIAGGKSTKLSPTSGPLDLLFLLPGTLFPRWLLITQASLHILQPLSGSIPLPPSLSHFSVVFSSQDLLPTETVLPVFMLLIACPSH